MCTDEVFACTPQRKHGLRAGEVGYLTSGPLFNIEVSNGGLISFPNGELTKDAEGTSIGAIGVSGSTVEEDATAAQAGVAAV